MIKKIKNKYSKIINFNNHKIGLYDVDTFVEDWGSKPKRGVAEKRCRIIKKGKDKVLEITIPKGTCSKGGSFWRLSFLRNLTDVTFEYDIMFGDKFDFVRGGKLPGLGGGASKGWGGNPEQYQNGFSARLMWREVEFEKLQLIKKSLKNKMKLLKEIIESNKSPEERKKMFNELNLRDEIITYEWLNRDLIKEPHKAYLVQYMYYPDRETTAGDDQIYKYKGKNIFVEPNKWFNIKMRIKLSEDPKEKDSVYAWVNGQKVLTRKINLRNKKSYGINQVMFSLFFGGQDPSFFTSKKEKVYFRRFIINGI